MYARKSFTEHAIHSFTCTSSLGTGCNTGNGSTLSPLLQSSHAIMPCIIGPICDAFDSRFSFPVSSSFAIHLAATCNMPCISYFWTLLCLIAFLWWPFAGLDQPLTPIRTLTIYFSKILRYSSSPYVRAIHTYLVWIYLQPRLLIDCVHDTTM